MAKKSYTRPTITELGDVVEETKGVFGGVWEITGETFEDIPPPDGGDDGEGGDELPPPGGHN
jgi:hypothetical protein